MVGLLQEETSLAPEPRPIWQLLSSLGPLGRRIDRFEPRSSSRSDGFRLRLASQPVRVPSPHPRQLVRLRQRMNGRPSTPPVLVATHSPPHLLWSRSWKGNPGSGSNVRFLPSHGCQCSCPLCHHVPNVHASAPSCCVRVSSVGPVRSRMCLDDVRVLPSSQRLRSKARSVATVMLLPFGVRHPISALSPVELGSLRQRLYPTGTDPSSHRQPFYPSSRSDSYFRRDTGVDPVRRRPSSSCASSLLQRMGKRHDPISSSPLLR